MGVGGAGVWNKRVKHARGRRPHTFVRLFLCNLGPQTPSEHNCRAIVIYTFFDFLAYWGSGQLQRNTLPTRGFLMLRLFVCLGGASSAGAGSDPTRPGLRALRRQGATMYGGSAPRSGRLDLAVLKTIFNFVLRPPPPGGPGEGPDCHVPKETVGFGLIPVRIRGVIGNLFLI